MIDVLSKPDFSPLAPARPADPQAPPAEALETLVAAVREGDATAFEGLYRQLVRGVFGLALRLAHDRTEAEELTQEVFVRAWEGRARFLSAAHLRNWLRRVTVNEWINRARKHKAVPFDDEGEGPGARIAAHSAPPGIRLDLERALGLLSPRLRGVLVLFDVYGLDHSEIAATMGMTAAASKVQLHRARRRLRELMP